MKKVAWPTRSAVTSNARVILGVVVAVAVGLAILDIASGSALNSLMR